jgi:hypothetical protein
MAEARSTRGSEVVRVRGVGGAVVDPRETSSALVGRSAHDVASAERGLCGPVVAVAEGVTEKGGMPGK